MEDVGPLGGTSAALHVVESASSQATARSGEIPSVLVRSRFGALVAWAPVAVLATPGAKDACAETLPGTRAVEGVVSAAPVLRR